MIKKHIGAMIAFGISLLFVVFILVSFISGTINSCVPNEDLSSTSDETVTEVITTTAPQIEMEPSTTREANSPVVNIPASSDEHYNNYQSYSEYEYDLVARTIYQESGICSEYCQWLVGSTILNLADERGGIENVVFDYNTFNVAYVLYDCTPSELSYKVAARVLSGDRDYNVKYFRTDYYHGFGTPYTNVDNVYFSTN